MHVSETILHQLFCSVQPISIDPYQLLFYWIRLESAMGGVLRCCWCINKHYIEISLHHDTTSMTPIKWFKQNKNCTRTLQISLSLSVPDPIGPCNGGVSPLTSVETQNTGTFQNFPNKILDLWPDNYLIISVATNPLVLRRRHSNNLVPWYQEIVSLACYIMIIET